MFNNIKDPNIASGFSALVNAFVPNTASLIEADLARGQREQMAADTKRIGVDATRLDADRQRLLAEADRLGAESARTKGFSAADAAMAAVLSDPNFDPSDPAWRGRLAAAAAGTEDGMVNGPRGVAGFSTFVDPQFAGSNADFSNVLMGVGLTDDYGKTPTGFAIGQDNEMAANWEDNRRARDVAAIGAEGDFRETAYASDQDLAGTLDANAKRKEAAVYGADLDAATATEIAKMEAERGVKPGAPATVSITMAQNFADAIAGRLEEQFPGAVYDDPQLVDTLTSEAIANYQQTKNAGQAIADVLAGIGSRTEDLSWLPTGDTTTVFRQPGAAPAPAAPSATPAPSAAPAPQIMVNPKTGERIFLDPATNEWRPVGPQKGAP